MKARLTYQLLIILLPAFACSYNAFAQLPDYQLDKIQEESGLKTADVVSMQRDKKGFLWLATQSVVQQFDGRLAFRFPFNETITKLLTDHQDRKWVLTRGGVSLFSDSLRNFQQVSFSDGGRPSTIYETADGSVHALTGGKFYVFDEKQQKFLLTTSFNKRISRYYGEVDGTLFFGNTDSVFVYRQREKQLMALKIGRVYTAIPVNKNEFIVSTWRFETFHVNIVTGEMKLLGSNDKQPIGNDLIVFGGLQWNGNGFLFCSNKGLFQYNTVTHSVANPIFYFDGRPLENQQSISQLYKDNAGNIYMDHADGVFFLGGSAGFIQYFRNYSYGNERMSHNDVRNFAEDEEGNTWMATINGIAMLNMQTGVIKSFDPVNKRNIVDFPSYRQLLNDGRFLWIGTSGNGVWVYDKQEGICNRPKFAGDETGRKQAAVFNSTYVWKVLRLMNGKLLVIGGGALFTIDPVTHMAQRLDMKLNGAVSRSGMQDITGRIWHGTTAGLVCFDTAFNVLFKIKDSFPDKRVASFCEWKKDKMLVGSKGLFEVELNGDKIISFKQKKGVPAGQFIYCMKQDKNGFVWLGTDDGILRYDPINDESVVFDKSDHVQSQAFNSDAAFINSKGILFMGGKNGVNYFDPQKFAIAPEKLQPLIMSFAVNVDDSIYHIPGYKIPYSSRNIDFVISAPEFRKTFRLQYRYRLRSKDEQWAFMGFNNHVRISKLQPGDYALQVSASYDGINWFDGAESASFTVLKPWWQTWWFRMLALAAAACAVWLLLRYRRKRREATEMKKTIEYFTYSGVAEPAIGPLLWDITRNCISRLGFEDCVIYLLDTEKKVLVQKAAYGAKSKAPFQITNPIVIPLGKGITGQVASTGAPLIVNDTARDARNIVDDQQRFSEITVPIIYQGKVIGVIDSENSKRNFFTRHHLKTLETISSLCASKIATALAVDAAKKAEAELQVLNGKITESKFMNLRLQMNPHFLFNVLTTIQYLIVSNQVNKATSYLDIFSGFLRSLLSYAEATVVTLEEELRVLTMYVELESLCLDETFVWEVNVCDEVDRDEVLVPFMLLQPFVENAINHGLIHKVGEKRFCISIKEHDCDSLICIIEDNGIGRTASDAINRKKLSGVLHQSKGIGIVEERLELLQKKTSKRACFEIEDLYKSGAAQGTRVSIIIPYYSNEEI